MTFGVYVNKEGMFFCLAGEFSIRNTIRSLPLIQFRVTKTA